MKTLLPFLLLCSSLPASAADLSGMKLRYVYDNGNEFELCFHSPKSLTWKAVKGAEAGTTDTEAYSQSTIAPGIELIGWVEKSGFTVSQVLNLNDSRITAHLVFAEKPGDKPMLLTVRGRVEVIGKSACPLKN